MNPAVRITTDADNVVTICMDVPGKPVNACSPQFLSELLEAIVVVEHARPAGVIFASGKPRSFNAGADLFEVRDMKTAQLAEYLARGHALFARIADLPMPTIAAINGDCLGGGFELALACRYRVAADSGSISIGLPEVKLGLIPAWGGTTRLPRMIGLRRALPILLAGKTLPPRKALRAGLVDEVVRPEALLAAAKRVVLSGARRHRPSWLDRAAAKAPPVRSRILDAARRETIVKTHGNYPAPLRLLEVVRIGFERGFSAGLEAERRAILELTETDAGRNLLRLFFLRQGAKKRAGERVVAPPHEVKHAAVIGGGTMGAGIAHALIRAGIPVRLVEVSPPAVSAALGRIQHLLDDDVAAGRIDRLAARHALNRVSPTARWTGLELADLVIEAVVETIEAKREVFARLDRLTRPGAVLATNTSALRVSEMAQATLHPERVVGLHFFNPVAKMPLVEVVRAPQSDDAALAMAIALAVRLGKTPVLVNDRTGFLINRILVPYLAEALMMAGEGVPIGRIDEAMKRWGMPMGVFELLDEIGLDIAAHVIHSLAGATPAPADVVGLFERAMDRHWLGKKSGTGFYLYRGRRRGRSAAPEVNEELIRTVIGAEPPMVDIESIQWRLVLPMVNESARVLEEGVTDSADAIDLATVLGLGLAPFRGGIVQFANTVGTGEIVRRLDELAAKYGPRFEPAALLREVAARHGPLAPRFGEPSVLQPPAPQQEHAIHT
jgi:3-hydroxyacyl-CoA dehydrogenase/enoyl-CoA hydratase/3-hydroxybutyryl-CoA epimerase